MDDLEHGTRNKRGDWRPNEAFEYPPVLTWPLKPVKAFKWFFGYPGYIWPWNAVYLAVTAAIWYLLMPSQATMSSLTWGWALSVFVRNSILTLLFYGAFHYYFYYGKKQGTSFKFNGRWPDEKNSAFLFNNQNKDNVFWAFVSAVPIWSAFEILIFWAANNGYAPVVTDMSVWYFILVLVLIPVWRDIHFYCIHRAIHWPPLYKYVHKLHHNNVNPGPWSGLAMHPVEHLLYFSNIMLFFFVPFHPFHALFLLFHTALVPAQVHAGFERIVLDDGNSVDLDDYSHYLHHKFFECNYSDGMLPLDKWFGTLHDGSIESEQQMLKRFKEKNAKLNQN